MTRETLTLRSADIPRVVRFGLGFDQLLEELVRSSNQNENYPPHNIIRETDDRYVVELAVAGFEEGDITVTVERRSLVIIGDKLSKPLQEPEYVHRGISSKYFKFSRPLADHVEVLDATLRNGILTVTLERQVPEAEKPKTIAINYVK